MAILLRMSQEKEEGGSELGEAPTPLEQMYGAAPAEGEGGMERVQTVSSEKSVEKSAQSAPGVSA